jgi:Ca-activated chloride channel family protein
MKDWLDTNRIAPSWLLSVTLHAVMIWLLLALAPAWNQQPPGNSREPTREIGIFMKDRGDNVVSQEQEGTTEDSPFVADDTSNPLPADSLTPQTAVPAQSAIEAPLPKADNLPGIGPGPSFDGGSGLPDPKELISPKGNGAGGKGMKPGAGIPGASFMGVQDQGTRVVYVVDASGSMYHHNAMRAAKAALVASLQNLDQGQQFQIIFYNDAPYVMRLKSAPKKQLYFATDINKNAARQFINGIEPDSGTQHLDAIKLALSFGPEVVFVLTDSGDPVLTPRELDEIQRKNGGRARIHCIEFGIGSELGNTHNFLKKLAHQNDGTHRYVDVTEFSRPPRER